jgi:hypothetical protein
MIVETKVSAMSEFAEPGHPDDKQVMLVIHFRSGRDGYIRVPPQIAKASGARSMMDLVRQRQASGGLPPGEVARVLRGTDRAA